MKGVTRANFIHLVKTEARLNNLTPIEAIELFEMVSTMETPHQIDCFLKRVPANCYNKCMEYLS